MNKQHSLHIYVSFWCQEVTTIILNVKEMNFLDIDENILVLASNFVMRVYTQRLTSAKNFAIWFSLLNVV